jgi:1-acyl-sn-glycerol-3-phosphate acyltransferase
LGTMASMITASKLPLLEKVFVPYTAWSLRRHFRAVHLMGDVPKFDSNENLPLLVCLNHSSWWDVMLGLYAAYTLFDWEAYSVMDERQLQRYRFFSKLGMIGADRTSLAGIKEFLRYAETLLAGKRRALWITAQGEFTSNLVRPIQFQPGIAHIAEQLGDCLITTVAFHYEFWNEPKPEAFVSMSPLTRLTHTSDFNRRTFLDSLERRMEAQLDALLAAVQKRDASAFHVLLRSGKRGQDHGAVVTPKYGQR